MKSLKFTFLLFAALTLGLTSCRKNGPDEKIENQTQLDAKAKILGKWKLMSAVFIETKNGQAQSPEVHDLTLYDYYFDFKTNNTAMLNYKTLIGEYNFSFSEDGKTFTATKSGASTITYEVKQNTETSLVLRTTHILSASTKTEDVTLQKTN